MVGVLGRTHSGGHPGCWSVWVPVLPWPWDEEEAEAGLSEGPGREIQGGGDRRCCHQAGLRPHHLWSGKSWEKRSFPGLDGRSAVFSMTITCTGNGDQFVEQNDSQTLEHPSCDFCPWGVTARLNYSHCHKASMMLWPNHTNIYNLFNTAPEALPQRFSSSVGMRCTLHAAERQPAIHCVKEIRAGSTNYVGSSHWIGEVKKKMQPCYFWISVTFGPCIVYVITGGIFLVIIKHITGPKQCKTALTSFIIRVVLQCALFSVH